MTSEQSLILIKPEQIIQVMEAELLELAVIDKKTRYASMRREIEYHGW
jgi:hypothetical protein